MSKTKIYLFVALIVGNLVLTGLIVHACFAAPRNVDGPISASATAQEENAEPEETDDHDDSSASTGQDNAEAIAGASTGQSTDMDDLLDEALRKADATDDSESKENPDISAPSKDPAECIASADQGTASAPAPQYGTKENGTAGDFVWFLEGKNKKSRPDKVKNISNCSSLEGGWKYVIVLDPENKRNEAAVEYGHAELSFMGWMADVSLHRHRLHIPGIDAPADLTKEPVTQLSGKWENGVLWANGKGKNTVRFTDFYEQDGQQFVTGSYVTFDAIEAKIALVRP